MLVAVTGSVYMAVTPLLAGYGLELWLFSVKVLLASSSQTIFVKIQIKWLNTC